MSTVKVKICGLTRTEDVQSVVAAGVDAVGFVFARSPRMITAKHAKRLSRHVPEDVLRVGLFMDQTSKEIESILNETDLDVLQFHGSETGQQCRYFGLPFLKAVAMADERAVENVEREYPDAMGWLLDSHTAGERGGSGRVFDWSLPRPSGKQIWLAGGLDADNVNTAIRMINPYAVDVSSGVEESPGIKDPARIDAFLKAVKRPGAE